MSQAAAIVKRSRFIFPALLGFCLLARAIMQGQQFRGYDAYTHVFFASHYARSWWVTWEPRWYQGFDVTSYPPLAHQLLALASFAIGAESAYKLVLLLIAAAFPVAIYSFARAFVDPATARLCASCSLLMPAFAWLLIPNGQLPGLLSLELLLLGSAAAANYLRSGSHVALVASVAAVGAAAASHHATPVLLGPFLLASILWRVLAGALAAAAAEGLRGNGRWLVCRPIVARMGLVGLLSGAAALLVVWPFWLWWLSSPRQAPIDHPSRHSFLFDGTARWLDFWLPYSLSLIGLPLALWQGFRNRSLWLLAAAGAVVFVLSLGGTTPLPRLLYGSGWEWLTYERYTLWASCLLLPLLAVQLKRVGDGHPRLAALGVLPLTLAMATSTAYAAWYGSLRQLEPAALDLAPVESFLAQPSHQGWRYLTLGLGDQMSQLSARTSAASIDGNYNAARGDPLLLASGIEKIDGIKYWDPQATVLKRVLAAPEPSHLGWVFVNDPFYDPTLREAGWLQLTRLSDGVTVWSPVQMPSQIEPAPGRVSLDSIWWGTVPLLFLLTAAGSLTVLQISSGGWAIPRRVARRRGDQPATSWIHPRGGVPVGWPSCLAHAEANFSFLGSGLPGRGIIGGSSVARMSNQPLAVHVDDFPRTGNGADQVDVLSPTATNTLLDEQHVRTSTSPPREMASSLEERLGRAAAGAILLWAGYMLQSATQVPAHAYLVPLSLLLYVGGFIAFLGAAVAVPISITGQRLFTWILILFLLLSIALNAYAAIAIQNPRYGTDGIALAHLAVEHVLSGANPYASVADASDLTRFGVPLSTLTQTMFGQFIPNALSYPSLSFLDYVPFFAVGVHDLRWIVLLFELLSLCVIAAAVPHKWKLWALVAVVADTDLSIYFASGGVVDWIWVLPLLLMIVCLRGRHVLSAALCFGIAVATKQQPWFLAPFLAVWLYKYQWATCPRRISRIAKFFLVTLIVFLVTNLPFTAGNPHAWFSSVLAPLFQPPDGQGLSLLGQFSLIRFSEATYSAIFAGAAVIAWVAYFLYCESAPSAVWLLPAIVLWFSHRSFQSYFVYWTPIFILGLALERELKPVVRHNR